MNMQINFVCYADIRYLPQFLLLHKSINNFFKIYTINILCLDEKIYLALKKLDLAQVNLITLGHLDQYNLDEIRSTRSYREFVWSLTPTICHYCLKYLKIKNIAFIDVDIEILSPPTNEIFDFMSSQREVMITPHGFEPSFDLSQNSGIFCVQFIIFKGNNTSIKIIEHWMAQCNLNSSSQSSHDVFGDQFYLNEWPSEYGDIIYIYQQKEHFQAPWNTNRFPYSEAFLYHFQGFRVISEMTVYRGHSKINNTHINFIYKPFERKLQKQIKELKKLGISVKYHDPINLLDVLKSRIWDIRFRLLGR
jgi:hypothetical protein